MTIARSKTVSCEMTGANPKGSPVYSFLRAGRQYHCRNCSQLSMTRNLNAGVASTGPARVQSWSYAENTGVKAVHLSMCLRAASKAPLIVLPF